jgi:hypothetical protein
LTSFIFDRLAPRKPRPIGRRRWEVYKINLNPFSGAKHFRKAEAPPFRVGKVLIFINTAKLKNTKPHLFSETGYFYHHICSPFV